MGNKPIPIEKRKKRPRIPRKLSKNDIKVCKTVSEHPDWNDNKIGAQLVKDGVYGNSNTIYTRLKQSDTLAMTVNALREYHLETFIRDNIPIANRNVKKGLKDKQLRQENPNVFYKLNTDVIKLGLGKQEEQPVIQQQVNIGQIQAVIQNITEDKSNTEHDN